MLTYELLIIAPISMLFGVKKEQIMVVSMDKSILDCNKCELQYA